MFVTLHGYPLLDGEHSAPLVLHLKEGSQLLLPLGRERRKKFRLEPPSCLLPDVPPRAGVRRQSS